MATIVKHITKIRRKIPAKQDTLITIPKEILDKAVAEKSIEQIEDYLEDWELAHDPVFLSKMRKARKEIESGKTIPWEQVQAKLGIKSK